MAYGTQDMKSCGALWKPWWKLSSTKKHLSMAKRIQIKGDDLTREHALKEATAILSSGGVVALPTDTLYGVAASVNSTAAIERLYEIKGRSRNKPIAICVSDIEDIFKWAKVTVSTDILHDLFPGPVTAVFERQEILNRNLNPGVALIGIRVPDYPFIRKLAKSCGHPLALTSANLSNDKSTLEVEEFQELWSQIDLVLDGGKIVQEETSQSRLGSTVIGFAHEGKFTVIREGSTSNELEKLLKDKYKLTKIS